MPAPIYTLNQIIYVADMPTVSVKRGKITKVITDPSNQYRVDFIYPDIGTNIIDETFVFLTYVEASTYVFNFLGIFPIPPATPFVFEEGVFTPVMVGSTTSPDGLYGNQANDMIISSAIGKYQRLGAYVHFMIDVHLTNKGSLTTGMVALKGLPYGINNDDDVNDFAVTIGTSNFLFPAGHSDLNCRATGEYNYPIIAFSVFKQSDGRHPLLWSDVPTDFNFNIAGTYKIDINLPFGPP